MVSEINKSITPVGLFGCGVSLSGGQVNPVLIGGESKNPVSDTIDNFQKQASEEVPNYQTGFPSTFSTFGAYVTSSGITSIAYNKATFKSKVGGNPGSYTFQSYDDSGTTKWNVTNPDSSVTNNITLSQYGITISGTTEAGEGFITTYTQNLSTPSDYSVVTSQIIRTTIWIDNVAKKFLLGDFNMLCHLGTLERYRRQLGGIRTFSSSFSTLIGGYPKGAQLEYLIPPNTEENPGTRYKLRKVVSLVDNNEYDFTTNGVDNVHWMYCDVLDPSTNIFMASTSLSGAKKIGLFGICEDDFRITDSKRVSYTLTQDCFVYDEFFFITSSTDCSASITVVKDGNQKTFMQCSYAGNRSLYYWSSHIGGIDNYGKIVKKGSTITASYNVKQCKYLYGSVLALPVVSTVLERL